MPYVEALIITYVSLKLIIHSSGQSELWDQRAISYPLLLNQKIAVMHQSEPQSYNKPFLLLCSQDFGFTANDPVIESPFDKAV